LDLEKKFPAFITKRGGSGTFIEGLYLQPLTTIHLHSHISGEIEANSDSAFIYVFSAIAAVILLIACFNFVNLATAQHLKRAREIGMRKVLGARKEQIVKQYLGEGVVLTFLSLPFVFVLVELFLPVFNRIVKKNLSVGYFGNAFFLFGIIGVAFFVGMIASVYPGMFLASFHPLRALRGGRSVSARSSFRNVLVLVQFSLSVLLIISTLVIHHQLRSIRNKKLGLNQDHVVVLPVKQRQDLVRFQSLKNEWLRDPHILKVAFSSDVPGRTSVNGNPFIPEGFDSDSRLTIDNMRVDYDFLPTLGITLKQGHNFSRDFAMDESQAFILNESAVEKIGWESPVGKQIVWRGGREK